VVPPQLWAAGSSKYKRLCCIVCVLFFYFLAQRIGPWLLEELVGFEVPADTLRRLSFRHSEPTVYRVLTVFFLRLCLLAFRLATSP